ncbi:DNA repair and recombination protein RAD54B-like [Uloborus diversus]|uniref:DNA repair and recombination protein RAD54B-like n=1 Tax=Uloborus diversus TaxID=327109 RepID=UPI0024092F6A|nr:DNA repair and recombination protein RAD54B-like [Uloborus diversus]
MGFGFKNNLIEFYRLSHKLWEGDGILTVSNRTASLRDLDGKIIEKGIGYKIKEVEALEEGSKFFIGGKECEIQSKISQTEDTAPVCNCVRESVSVKNISSKINLKRKVFKNFEPPPMSSLINNTTESETSNQKLFLPSPSSEHQHMYNKEKLHVSEVKVDDFLANQLRPHQKEGVIFMYKCILGLQHDFGHGVILADEMGLGKTLQCITLIWTLFKQGPYGNKPLLKNVIIITPSSLVKNWQTEFIKWLGKFRLSIFLVDQKNTVKDFVKNPQPVLILSYEMFLRSAEILSSICFDLVICDEGHRLKNLNIKLSNAVACLSTTRRILLTGTPIQNDLAEFFSLVDFVNPGALGSIKYFRRTFEKPILQAQSPDSSEEEKECGEEQGEELGRITGTFMLRRTQEVINQYLPSKFETVVLCQPTHLQRKLYKALLQSRAVVSFLSSMSFGDLSTPLVYISILRKLCNHPSLLFTSSDDKNSLTENLDSIFASDYIPCALDSGKMKVLEKILSSMFNQNKLKKEKVVIVSNFTKTLDIIEEFCKMKSYEYLRLDGSTKTSSRQQLVDTFNLSYTKFSVFLLSNKAGGVGFNLIGASRIILYDIDWNPANDLQAMARIWRDGQKHSVYVYRLLTTGTIEEKIYQRQVSKQSLSGSVLNQNSSENLKFSHDELRDLFTFHENTKCLIHDSMNCNCVIQKLQTENLFKVPICSENASDKQSIKNNASMTELAKWTHIPGPISAESTPDACLADCGTDVTFLFLNKVN